MVQCVCYFSSSKIMYFVSENILTLTIAAVFLAALLSIVLLRRKQQLRESSVNHTEQAWLKIIRFTGLAISAILLSIALLGPRWLMGNSSTQQGIDQIWLLDVSASMDVVDETERWTPISRLKKAKGVIEQYMLLHPENRYGLVIFAGDWRLVSPLTSEHASLLTFLSGLDSKGISEWGTDFTDALAIALNRFDSQNNSSQAIVLLSDGGDKEDSIDIGTIKDLFYKKKASLITLGLGEQKPSPIPNGRNMFGDLTYKQFQGQIVLSALNNERLKALADIGWGILLSEASSLEKALSDIEKKSIVSESPDSTVRLFIFLSLSSFLIFLLPSSFLKLWNAS